MHPCADHSVTCRGTITKNNLVAVAHAFPYNPAGTASNASFMSFLRRRFGGGGGGDDSEISTPELSREPSPGPDGKFKRPANLRLITAEQLQTLKKRGQHKKRRNFWVFGLGGIFGLLLAGFFASSNDMIDLSSLEGVNLESIMEALPDNFVKSAQQMQVRATFASYRGGLDGRFCGLRGIEADCPNSVEIRKRRRKLRFLRRRSSRAETRHQSQTPCYHDPRCHLHGSGILGHGRRVETVLSQETVGVVDDDARARPR